MTATTPGRCKPIWVIETFRIRRGTRRLLQIVSKASGETRPVEGDLSGENDMDDLGDCVRLKRYALQIVCQLPDSRVEAMKVLEYARELVDWEAEHDPRPVLQLIG
jgi:hypothetical protein